METCIICNKKTDRILTRVKGVDIYECPNCRLGITGNRPVIDKTSLPYDFADYDTHRFRFARRLEIMIDRIKRFAPRGRLLEVGGGFGLFSSLLLRSGYEVDTIEPYLRTHYLEGMKNAHVITKTFEQYAGSVKNHYDGIVMLDVLEHVENPVQVLKGCKSMLKPGGVIILQMPNYRSLMQWLCRDWSWWMIEDHTFHFTPHSLKKLLRSRGFTPQYVATYEEFPDFLKNLDGNFSGIKNSIMRKVAKLMFRIVFIPLYLALRPLIWGLGRGGLLFVVATK